jgi:hypothetical protein
MISEFTYIIPIATVSYMYYMYRRELRLSKTKSRYSIAITNVHSNSKVNEIFKISSRSNKQMFTMSANKTKQHERNERIKYKAQKNQ